LNGHQLSLVPILGAQLQEVLITVHLPSLCICEVVFKRYSKLDQYALTTIPNDNVRSLTGGSYVRWKGVGYTRQVCEDVVVRDVGGEKGVNKRQDRVMPLIKPMLTKGLFTLV
jgi:hypothetical protein